MSRTILVLSQNHYASVDYGLDAGCEVHDVRTIEAARALLRAGVKPEVIILDAKFAQVDMAALMRFVRQEMGLEGTRLIVTGSSDAKYAGYVAYADDFAPRPVKLAGL